MSESSIITLNEKAVFNNINFLRKLLGNKVVISSVVKANAYGHGIEHIIPLFEQAGIHHFSVFDYHEAVRVSKSLTQSGSIMIMGWISSENLNDAIRDEMEFFVYNLERLYAAIDFTKQPGKKAKIHLETETGMNRSGLNVNELYEAIHLIKENIEHIEIKGFCTHLAGAESISNHFRIQKQLKKYQQMLEIFENSGLKAQYKHVANSAASVVYPKTRMDMVRIGIMQYGFWPTTETFIHYITNRKNKSDPLNRILDWKSRVMSTKEVKTGEYIGYGISFQAQFEMKTALIPIGYSCGYSRSLSNKGYVLIRGQRCNVIGLVNMNMIIADITHVPETEVNDEVVIIGKQGDLEIKVGSFGDSSNKLNYEVLSHLSQSIKRIIIKNQ
jgi:alanine racemase